MPVDAAPLPSGLPEPGLARLGAANPIEPMEGLKNGVAEIKAGKVKQEVSEPLRAKVKEEQEETKDDAKSLMEEEQDEVSSNYLEALGAGDLEAKPSKMVSRPPVVDPSMQDTLVVMSPSPLTRALTQDSNPVFRNETPVASKSHLAPALAPATEGGSVDMALDEIDRKIAQKQQLDLKRYRLWPQHVLVYT